MPAKPMSGSYGLLTVLRREGSTARGAALWRCLCACGRETVVPGWELRLGKVGSCGCRREANRDAARRRPADREHQRRLTRHVWPRACRTCGAAFLGTARQVYCQACASPSVRSRRQRQGAD
jgi:hypothetical protein